MNQQGRKHMTDELRNDQRDLIEYLKHGHISIDAIMDYMIEKRYVNDRFNTNSIDVDEDGEYMTFLYTNYFGSKFTEFTIIFEIIDPLESDYSTIEMSTIYSTIDSNDGISLPRSLGLCVFEIRHFDDIDLLFNYHWPKFLRQSYRRICKKRNQIDDEELKTVNMSKILREIKIFKK